MKMLKPPILLKKIIKNIDPKTESGLTAEEKEKSPNKGTETEKVKEPPHNDYHKVQRKNQLKKKNIVDKMINENNGTYHQEVENLIEAACQFIITQHTWYNFILC